MTEKELHRLKRHDLLQLLLAQGREAAELQSRINDLSGELEKISEANERFITKMDEKDEQIGKLKERLGQKDERVEKFKERLNEKDAQIEKLKSRLDQKDTHIMTLRAQMEEYRSGKIFELNGKISIAEVSQKLEGIFAAAQKAVDQYLLNVREAENTPYFESEDVSERGGTEGMDREQSE